MRINQDKKGGLKTPFKKKYKIVKSQMYIYLVLIILSLFFCPKTFAQRKFNLKIAILPFENMSGEYFDIDNMMNIVYQKLKQIAELSPREAIDRVLIDLRLRHTGFLTTKDAIEIGKRLNVQGILLGIVSLYKEGPEPSVGLILKLLSTKEGAPLVWMKADLASGSDIETWFGLKRIADFDQLFDRFIDKYTKNISFERLEKLDIL